MALLICPPLVSDKTSLTRLPLESGSINSTVPAIQLGLRCFQRGNSILVCLRRFQRRNSGQLLAFEPFKECATGG